MALRRAGPPSFLDICFWWACARSELVPHYVSTDVTVDVFRFSEPVEIPAVINWVKPSNNLRPSAGTRERPVSGDACLQSSIGTGRSRVPADRCLESHTWLAAATGKHRDKDVGNTDSTPTSRPTSKRHWRWIQMACDFEYARFRAFRGTQRGEAAIKLARPVSPRS